MARASGVGVVRSLWSLPVARSRVFLMWLLCAGALVGVALGEGGSDWEQSTATYYGGGDAQGTMGGACGYGNLYDTGYGQMTAAASIAMWDSGRICGSCFEVECVSSNIDVCIPGAKVVVTVTNQCPEGSEGGWCNSPHRHLDMAMPAWLKIASDPKAGVLTTRMRRVPCAPSGGVSFQVSGNPFWSQVLVFNVAGAGDLDALQVSTDGGATWRDLKRNWGSVWSGGGQLLGHALSFRLRAHSRDETLTIRDAIPSNWYLGGTYRTSANFQVAGQQGQQGSSSGGSGSSSGYRQKGSNRQGHVPMALRWWRKKNFNAKTHRPVMRAHVPVALRWWRKQGVKGAHA